MPEPVSSTASAMKLAALLLEEAEKQGVIDKIKNWFKTKPRVLLLGSTGTGKTNFLQSLSVERPEPIDRANRTVFADSHVLMIKGSEKQPYRFVDTPGDASPGFKDARIDAIREAMSAKVQLQG